MVLWLMLILLGMIDGEVDVLLTVFINMVGRLLRVEGMIMFWWNICV